MARSFSNMLPAEPDEKGHHRSPRDEFLDNAGLLIMCYYAQRSGLFQAIDAADGSNAIPLLVKSLAQKLSAQAGDKSIALLMERLVAIVEPMLEEGKQR